VADTVDRDTRSFIMSRIRSKNTRAELRVKARLDDCGLTSFRHDARDVFGRPDFYSDRLKVAVFVDGCFWHVCPKHFKVPGTHKAWWMRKLARNVERDEEVTRKLRRNGVSVIRVWECEVLAVDGASVVVKAIRAKLKERRLRRRAKSAS